MDTQGTPATGPAPIPTTAEALAEVAATAPKAGAPTDGHAPPDTSADSAKTGSLAEGEKKADAKPPVTEATALSRIAREQRRLDAEKKAFEAKQAEAAERNKATFEKAARWDRFEEAKTKSGRAAALKEIYDEGEITNELYGELTDLIIAQSKTPTQEELVERKIQEKLDAAKKSADEETKKAAEANATAQATQIEQLEAKHVSGVVEVFNASPTKWPFVNAFGVSDGDIRAFMRAEHQAGRAVPSREDVLNHFESDFKSKSQKAAPVETKPGPSTRTVTNDWKSDAPVRTGNGQQTLAEITEQAKREAGVIK